MHKLVKIKWNRRPSRARRRSSKCWEPLLSPCGKALLFQESLRANLLSKNCVGFDDLEQSLLIAVRLGGTTRKTQNKFNPSVALQNFPCVRRRCPQACLRKLLSFQIRKRHRKEFRAWKAATIAHLLESKSRWWQLRTIERADSGMCKSQQCSLEDFATCLETMFRGNPDPPRRPEILDENPWSLPELKAAIVKLRVNKAGDEPGLVAELLKLVPDDV